ncbi:MAG: hypothetical protein AAGA77_23885 [Bacteroidota bacterium]
MKNDSNKSTIQTFLSCLLAFIFCLTASAQCIPAQGGAIINEFSNGPAKNQEFIEILVIGDETGANVNLQGYILDDNNDAKPGVGNEPGHVVFGSCFADLSPGQLILIYNDQDPHPGITALVESSELMIIPFNDPCIIKMEGCPNYTTDSYDCAYQVHDPNANWVEYIPAHNYGDKIQILNREKETIHAFDWGLPSPGIDHSTQQKAYIHNTAYKYSWQSYSESTPGVPNNFANELFIEYMQSGNIYEGLNATFTIECMSISINLTGGFPNYSFLLDKVIDYNSQIQKHSGISSTGQIGFTNLACGKYVLNVTDKLGCTYELEFSISGKEECYVLEPPNQSDYYIGDQCPTCQSSNNCFEWESSLGTTFGFAIPTGKNLTLPYEKGIELKSSNGHLIRKEYDLQKATILSETKYWFNEGDLEGVCSDTSTETCSGTDSDGDGICDAEDSCPNSQDNDDSDEDGLCDIFDCAPDNANESIDSDGDGVCDGLDCAPNNPEYNKDSDGDGVCDHEDCQPLNEYIYAGAPCNDHNDCTKNDMRNSNCECIGTPIPHCSEECNEGDQCDDNDPCTRDDRFDADCNCKGIRILNCEECSEGSTCDDNNHCTYNDTFDSNCLCKGTQLEDCSEENCVEGAACDDSNPCTINDIFGSDCFCEGTPLVGLTIRQESIDECFGDLLLTASGGNGKYSWYRNEDLLGIYSNQLVVTKPGEYKVKTRENELCEFSKSITVANNLFDPQLEISQSEKSICNESDPVELSIDPNLTESQWSLDGVLIPEHNDKTEILIYQEGIYSVQAKNTMQCLKTGEIQIYTPPDETTLPIVLTDIKITPQYPVYCAQSTMTLSIGQQPSSSLVQWSTGEFTSSITVTDPGTYSVTVTNAQGCINTDKVEYLDESALDIDQILQSNGFVKERVKIHSVVQTATTKGDPSTTRDLTQEVNVDNVNSYEILRIQADPEPEPQDLIKFAQKRVDTHYHYDQEATGLLVDDFCPDNNDGYTLTEFINYSKTHGAFAYYIEKAETGEETFLYYRQADFMAGIGGVDHDNLFKEVLYTILCNRKNGKNTVLDKPSLYEIQKSNTGGTTTFSDYVSLDYIISGSILLPDRDQSTFWADVGIGTWNPFSDQRGILISNYRHNGVLLTSNKDNISAPEYKKSTTITAKREKIKADVRGGFWEIKIKYDPNSISSLEGELGEETQPENEEYLVISIPNQSYRSTISSKDMMNGLFNHTDEYIDLALADNRLYPSPELLPACLFESNELCTLIKHKYKNTLTPGSRLAAFNKVLADPINDLKDGFSESVIECFEDHNQVDNYYHLGTEYFGEDKVNFLGNLNFHFFEAFPNFNPIVENEDDYVKLIQLSVGDPGENDDLEDDVLFYDIKSINDDYFDYQYSWQRWIKLSNLYDLDWGGEGEYVVLSNFGSENKEINYFDRDPTTEDKERYPLQLSKEYNFLTKEQIPIYFDDQFKLVDVPGIYIAYAVERKKYEDAITLRDNAIDLAAIAFSFGELSPAVYAARLGRVRTALAIGEISTSSINLFLRNSDWCKDVEPVFCQKWQQYVQAAQIALLAGQGSTFLYSKLKPVKKYYNSLPPDGPKRQAIDDVVEEVAEDQNAIAEFNKLMDLNLDELAELKQVFSEVDNNYTGLIDQLFEAVQPNHTTLIELADEIKELLSVSGRKEFFSDLITTSNNLGKIGNELGSLTEGQIKAWKFCFKDPIKRIDFLWITKLSESSGLSKIDNTNPSNISWNNNIIGNNSSSSALDFWNDVSKNFLHYEQGDFIFKYDYESGTLLLGNKLSGKIVGYYEGLENISVGVYKLSPSDIVQKLKRYHGESGPSSPIFNLPYNGQIASTPGKTTTIIGKSTLYPYLSGDMKTVAEELLGNLKTLDYGAKPGGFNIFNVSKEFYEPGAFWVTHNKTGLQAAINRGDVIVPASDPLNINNLFIDLQNIPQSQLIQLNNLSTPEEFALYFKNLNDPDIYAKLASFGKEFELLSKSDYILDLGSKTFIK